MDGVYAAYEHIHHTFYTIQVSIHLNLKDVEFQLTNNILGGEPKSKSPEKAKVWLNLSWVISEKRECH